MLRQNTLAGLLFLLISCSGSADVDAATVLPGSWECDDEIILTFKSNGTYEWRVPPSHEVTVYVESNENIRMNDDGGHSIFDKWRLSSDTLEIDMFGETDRFSLKFRSATAFRMTGPDTLSCSR